MFYKSGEFPTMLRNTTGKKKKMKKKKSLYYTEHRSILCSYLGHGKHISEKRVNFNNSNIFKINIALKCALSYKK